jgi:K+-transporting ATPase KdpF subunit
MDMLFLHWAAALVSAGLLIYLLAALLVPEKLDRLAARSLPSVPGAGTPLRERVASTPVGRKLQ